MSYIYVKILDDSDKVYGKVEETTTSCLSDEEVTTEILNTLKEKM